LRYTRPEDICAQVAAGVFKQLPDSVQGIVEDFVLGCAYPEGVQGNNMARIVAGLAKLPVSVGAQTINRFCSSGLQSIATAANAIISGQQSVVMAGGGESMSAIPMGGMQNLPNPDLLEAYPDYFTSMGLTAENVAAKYQITRERMDAFAFASHKKAKDAQDAGRFASEIVPVMALKVNKEATGSERVPFEKDEGIRPETTLESLAKLRAVFKKNGVVTAGNSSQMTDGAAIVLLMEKEMAETMGIKPLARFVSFAVAGVEPGIMGIGPIIAIPKALKVAGLSQEDIDLIDLNEAFAAQALACMDVLGLDSSKVNVNGGAIALGHPLGCTGAALTVRSIRELERQGKRYGMVSMCIGGGQGAAGIFERL
jgi:acetyl-CoA acyltransferase